MEGYDAKLEALKKEHRERLRELKEANLELSARAEALKDACDGAVRVLGQRSVSVRGRWWRDEEWGRAGGQSGAGCTR